jgi:hypothetical protein
MIGDTPMTHKARTFHLGCPDAKADGPHDDCRNVLASPVKVHALGKGDMIAMSSEFGNGDFVRTVAGHPVHERGGDKLRIDLGDGLALGSGHLFGMNDTLYRVVGARSGPVGSR